ncbi:hypothetical protein D3C76_923630 [compost metagenome]
MVADVGHHLRLQQVVHVGISGLFIRRIDGHGDHVEPHRRALLGYRIAHLHAIVRLIGAVLRLQHIPREPHYHADIAVGQVARVLGRVEIADVRPHFHQQVLGLLVVLGVLAVMGQAQVVQGDRQQFGAIVQHRDATAFQLAHVLGLEDQVPGVHGRVVAEHRLDLVDVVANTGTAPQVREAVLVARVVHLQRLEQHRVEVVPVGQLRLVERLQGLALDLPGHEVVGGEHHVVAGIAGHQLAIEGFIAVVHVIGRHDAAGLLEVLQRIGGHVAGPVVDLHRFSGAGHAGGQHQGGEEEGAHVGFTLLCLLLSKAGDQRIRK